jgi:NAD(P)-dependent dehydrogenase (short-subunit alcohol dehydrogenase family)
VRFSDRVVVITGAGSGIGAAMAARFAGEGATVIVADINAEAAAEVAGALPGARAERMDVIDADQVHEVLGRTERDLGAVAVLVNNAAVCTDATYDELSEELWDRDVAVALKAAFLTTQTVLPGMVAAGRGAIVNISSVNALSYFGNEAYSAGKAGLLSLTRSIAVRYGRAGVRCNAIVPGTIATPIWAPRVAENPNVFDEVAQWYPLGRVGTPDDVASAALFLASDDAAWITGVALPVDGGITAGNARMTADITVDKA